MAGEFCRRIGCFLAEGHVGPCRFCRCGPDEACAKCSTPRPVVQASSDGPPPPCTCSRPHGWLRHHDGCRLAEWMRAADREIKDAKRRIVEREAEDERKPRDTQPMVGLDALLPERRPDVVNCRCLRGFAMLVPGVEAPCGNCGRVLVYPDDEKKRETSCAHQWVPWVNRRGDLQAWCPSCDKVKAPPEGVR